MLYEEKNGVSDRCWWECGPYITSIGLAHKCPRQVFAVRRSLFWYDDLENGNLVN